MKIAQNPMPKTGEDRETRSLFDQYSETFFDELHSDIDFEQTARGYGEYYYDCLPHSDEAPILDVGCGTGSFLRFLEIQGYKCTAGLELSAQQAERTRTHVNCPVHVGDVENYLHKRSKFYAAITLNDVLEHIPKDGVVNFLQIVKEGLREDGSLVVNVPNVAGLTTSYVRYNDFTHHLVFTEMSLQHVLRLAGFSHIRFVKQYFPFKWTLRHMAYRMAHWFWFKIVHLIYVLEMPGCRLPRHWQTRLVAVARP